MQHLPTYCWSIFLSLKSITAMCCSSTRQGRTRRRPRSRAVQLLRHLVQHLGGRGPPPGHRDEQIARRLSQAQRAGQQPRGVLAGGAVDAPFQVTDRPLAHLRGPDAQRNPVPHLCAATYVHVGRR